MTVIFLSCIDVKQQQNDRKLCGKDLGENVVILAWFSLLTGFCAEGTVLWLQAFVNRINGKQH